MTTTTATAAGVTTQVYRVYIKATPQAIWDAITIPEWAEKYGYASRVEYDLRPGGAYRGFSNEAMRAHGAADVILVGEVLESDPPRKLVQTWHALFDPATAAEPATTLIWEIVPQQGGVTMLTVTHDVAGAPVLARLVSGQDPNAGGGWSFVLSDLKTLLETGKAFAG